MRTERQLDLLVGTAAPASIVGRGEKRPRLSIIAIAEKRPRLSIVGPVEALAKIERRRRAAKISIVALLRAAGMHPSVYRDARKTPANTRQRTITRLAAALDTIEAGAALPAKTLAPIAALHRAVFALLAARAGDDDIALLLAQEISPERPNNPVWLRAATLRRQAMYMLAVELDLGNAAVARALGCRRQTVHAARRAIETDDNGGPLDPAMAAVAALVSGRIE